MVVRKANKVYPTMDVSSFKKVQCTIEEVKDVETKTYGVKPVAVLSTDKPVLEDSQVFNVFLNNYSIEKLGAKFGDDDANWKGKLVNLSLEKDEKYKKDMIVLNPVA